MKYKENEIKLEEQEMEIIENLENSEEEEMTEGTIKIIEKSILKNHIAEVLSDKITAAKTTVIEQFNGKVEEMMKQKLTDVEKITLEIPMVPLSIRTHVADELVSDFKKAGYESKIAERLKEKSVDPRDEEKYSKDFDTIHIFVM